MSELERCGDLLVVADDHGDNDCTFTCNREKGHAHAHREEFPRPDKDSGRVYVAWTEVSTR